MLPKYRAKVEVKYILFTAYNSYNLTMSRYRYYNPNPIKDTASDCVIRMLCKVTGKSWAENYLDVAERGLELGNMPSVNQVWISLLRDMGFRRYVISNKHEDCYSIEDFCIDHPTGLYILGTGTHVVAVEDGYYFDTWNSGRECPIFYLSR